jgi:hypothetical protein
MEKGIEAREKSEPTIESAIYEDSIIAGIFHALGHKVNPIKNSGGRIVYQVEGDTDKTIQGIYSNCPVGALDVMRSIKLTRSMIFNLRSGGGK